MKPSVSSITASLQGRAPEALEFFSSQDIKIEGAILKIKNVSQDAIQALTTESLYTRFKGAVSQFASEIQLHTDDGKEYRIPTNITVPDMIWNSNDFFKEEGGILDSIWTSPDAAVLISEDSHKILLGNPAFAQQAKFRSSLECWGLNARSTWLDREWEKLQDRLNLLPMGECLGSEEQPYEYSAIALSDTLKLIDQGLSASAALAEARRIEIAAIFRRVVIDGQLCRLSCPKEIRFP